jgi:ABC-type glutathione transport system ATPase component
MLFDEPMSALDSHLKGEVLDVMKQLTASDMTMIAVTHELSFAREVADTLAVMADGQIVESGPPERVLTNPTDPVRGPSWAGHSQTNIQAAHHKTTSRLRFWWDCVNGLVATGVLDDARKPDLGIQLR